MALACLGRGGVATSARWHSSARGSAGSRWTRPEVARDVRAALGCWEMLAGQNSLGNGNGGAWKLRRGLGYGVELQDAKAEALGGMRELWLGAGCSARRDQWRWSTLGFKMAASSGCFCWGGFCPSKHRLGRRWHAPKRGQEVARQGRVTVGAPKVDCRVPKATGTVP